MRRVLYFIIVCCAFGTMNAQNNDSLDIPNYGRPECFVDLQDGQSGPHKAMAKIGSQAYAPLCSKGIQKVPVLLVQFADKKFETVGKSSEEIVEYYDKFLNGTRNGEKYTGHGSSGAIRDYFVEQSDSVFLPEFSVIGPVTLSNGYAYYGQNSGSSHDNVNFSKFYPEALKLAMADYEVSWNDFDNNNDGKVDMVFYIYAGPGENTNSKNPDLIWPKESAREVTIDGVTFGALGCTSETRYTSKGEVADGIGVFIHELSHALGLPDFYDINYEGFGMDVWSVMDYGNYINSGKAPCAYTAYERDFMGWRQLKELTEPQVVTLYPFHEGGVGYKVVNNENSNEYYVLENRQHGGFDSSLCNDNIRCGMQVTHVDYLQSSWTSNRVNTTKDHQRMSIIAANGNYNGVTTESSSTDIQNAYKGHLYPKDHYTGEFHYDLTDNSTPSASVVFSASGYMSKPIRGITQNEDKSITLYFRTNGKLERPELEASDEDINSFTISWEEVENADGYEIELQCDSTVEVDEKILETSYSFDELKSNTNYTVRVKALSNDQENYLDGEWSEPLSVSTLVDVIKPTTMGIEIVDVYSINGILVRHCKSNEVSNAHLSRGVYILRYSNGQTKKLMIK